MEPDESVENAEELSRTPEQRIMELEAAHLEKESRKLGKIEREHERLNERQHARRGNWNALPGIPTGASLDEIKYLAEAARRRFEAGLTREYETETGKLIKQYKSLLTRHAKEREALEMEIGDQMPSGGGQTPLSVAAGLHPAPHAPQPGNAMPGQPDTPRQVRENHSAAGRAARPGRP